MFPYWSDIEQNTWQNLPYAYLLGQNEPLIHLPKSSKMTQITFADFQSSQSSCLYHEKKGMSLLPSFVGSITVECAIVLPMFLVFCIQLISIISLIQLHSNIEAALHQSVGKLAIQEYLLEQVGISEAGMLEDVVDDFRIRNDIIQYVGRKNMDSSMIMGGSDGLLVSKGTEAKNGQDVLEISVHYYVKPIIGWIGFGGILLGNHCMVKPWTGYVPCELLGTINLDEPFVYVTENGEVYHTDYACTHLQLSIEPIIASLVGSKRNDSGEKYYPCEYCGKGGGSLRYITSQGNRYHTTLNCSGLKRTIYKVPLSEVGGIGPCSRCAA